ncbi:hypothetical protein Nepgr_013647 [Nepenthes gracilis]|uniref:RING-type E3 ubiquitin transferase n=1 Tax=Nepenthes gracilis TaxID=150966 RepID=A0AAD3XPJ5_NEPGR|nr:hypothetical protein Nepgr_013647 [Nepenthes gracilis]
MWLPRDNAEKKEGGNALVAVAIDRDKGSQYAMKWTIDNLVQGGQCLLLIHVKVRHQAPSHASSSLPPPRLSRFPNSGNGTSAGRQLESQTKDFFLPFRCFCTRKNIQCRDIILEDTDVAKALIEYVTQSAVEILVIGATSKGGFLRFSKLDIPGTVSKGAPDFCTVYVISKNKILSTRSASRPAPVIFPPSKQIMNTKSNSIPFSPGRSTRGSEGFSAGSPLQANDNVEFRSPFARGGRHPHIKSYGELLSETDISFVSSGRPSVDKLFPSLYDSVESGGTPNMSLHRKSLDGCPPPEFSNISSLDGGSVSCWSQQPLDDVEAEMQRLKMELKQTMDMYSNACKEALTAKQQAMELQRWKMEEEGRLEEARLAEEAALALAEKERAKSRVAIEAAEAAQRIAELEAQKRISVEMKALKESEERRKALASMEHSSARYRKYTIEEIEAATDCFAESRKIGEGGYGPVYKCSLDHTLVAVKVLRPDAAQGKSQFQQEVEVLSCIRHPNMVLLLGACPEYGCLVYEYMHNGSLDDRLFCRGGTPPLSWQHRFRIAAEIATGLLFLHQTKPEPLVHRDLKPGNILLDRNLVSKISDVGLARLVPPSVADSVTQYRMTSTAGTFCYIDPEYQKTGMLCVKSDVYSLGVMLLQIITGKPAMGLTHYVEHAIEKGTLKDMLDPGVPDWPVEETLRFAKMALKCAELRRRDRPDLGPDVLPELNRLRDLAEDSTEAEGSTGAEGLSDNNPTQVSMHHEVMSDSPSPSESFRSRSSAASNGTEIK